MSKNGISYMLRAIIVQLGASSQSGQVPRARSIRGIATSSAFLRNWSLWSILEAVSCHSNELFLFICGIYPLIQMEFTL